MPRPSSTVDWLYFCLLQEKHQITHRDRADHKRVQCNLLFKQIRLNGIDKSIVQELEWKSTYWYWYQYCIFLNDAQPYSSDSHSLSFTVQLCFFWARMSLWPHFFCLPGATVNAKDHVWLTPLHRAAASRNEVSNKLISFCHSKQSNYLSVRWLHPLILLCIYPQHL